MHRGREILVAYEVIFEFKGEISLAFGLGFVTGICRVTQTQTLPSLA